VSDENEKLIEDTFITKLGAKYPFVTAKGVNELYAISFFPSIYCIAPDGTVLTVPKDREPAESFIEEQLKNVVLGPKLPADAKYDALRSMWAKKEHKKLQDFLTKALAQPNLDDESKAVYEAQQADLAKRIERQSARVPELGKGPDYGSAEKALEKMQKEWAGLPPADAAKAELERFAKDERIQDELAAQKALDKVVGKFDPTKLAQRRKLAEELDKFANTKKWSGTQAAQKAAAMRDEMAGK
jgi:hypothetical protein